MTSPPAPDTRDGSDDVPFDHRGRARPLYEGRGPTGGEWRPGRLTRLLLGLFPGLRVMASSSALSGLPYLILGLAALVLGGLLTLEWSIARNNVRAFAIQEVFLLMHAGAIVLAVLVFELLRFGASLEEKYYGSRAPRFLAALLLPSACVLVGGPKLVYLWPQLVEALWLTALVMVLGSAPAAVWSAAEGYLMSYERLRRFQIVVGVLLGLAFVAIVLSVLGAVGGGMKAWATDAGFVLLPRMLAG